MSDEDRNEEEFFIGWQSQPPSGIAAFLKAVTLVVLLGAVALGAAFPLFQQTLGTGRFQMGNVRDFSGVMIAEPVPMLLTAEPEPDSGQSVFLLVNPLKYGFDPDVARSHHLKPVSLKGVLIYDDGLAMIEVAKGSVSASGEAKSLDLGPIEDLGVQTLRGEIVDSKCYLGVMNPGVLKPHRACAIHCIRGGIPPVFLLRGEDGELIRLILTGPGGEPINQQILDFVADPVEITGQVRKCGSLYFLAADPVVGIRRIF